MKFMLSLAILFCSLGSIAQTANTLAARTDITVVCLLVNDHDEAISWYTEKLGFVVKQDVKYGEGERWVSLRPSDGAAFELSLGLAKTEADSAVVGRQGGSYPFLVLFSSDIAASYESFKGRGVEFAGEPKRGLGGMGVTFKDLYGNVIYLRGN